MFDGFEEGPFPTGPPPGNGNSLFLKSGEILPTGHVYSFGAVQSGWGSNNSMARWAPLESVPPLPILTPRRVSADPGEVWETFLPPEAVGTWAGYLMRGYGMTFSMDPCDEVSFSFARTDGPCIYSIASMLTSGSTLPSTPDGTVKATSEWVKTYTDTSPLVPEITFGWSQPYNDFQSSGSSVTIKHRYSQIEVRETWWDDKGAPGAAIPRFASVPYAEIPDLANYEDHPLWWPGATNSSPLTGHIFSACSPWLKVHYSRLGSWSISIVGGSTIMTGNSYVTIPETGVKFSASVVGDYSGVSTGEGILPKTDPASGLPITTSDSDYSLNMYVDNINFEPGTFRPGESIEGVIDTSRARFT